MAILEFITLFLCIIAFISAGYGDIATNSSRSEISVSGRILDGLNAIQQSQTISLFPATKKSDKLLLVAPDGTISLMDISSEKVIWSFASGSSTYSLYQALPNREGGSFFIDLGQDDWELYMHINDSTIVKLGSSAEEFIRHGPYVSSDGVLLGMKNTTVFLVDAKSGVIQTFGSAGSPNSVDLIGTENPIMAKKDGWQEFNGLEPLYITRTDYTLKYSSKKTGQVLWYLTFADIEASFKCQRIESFFGANYSDGDEVCQTSPLVYRIHNRGSLESMVYSDRLAKFPSRGEHLSRLGPGIKRQDVRGKIMPALPHSETEDIPASSLHRPMRLPGANMNFEKGLLPALPHSDTGNPIFALPNGEHDETTAKISPEYQPKYIVGFLVPLFILLSTIAVLFRGCIRNNGKSNLQATDLKVQPVMHKKKKPRKSAIAKNNTVTNKKQQNVVHEGSADGCSEPLDFEKVEKKFEQAFDCVDVIDGRRVGKIVVSNKQIAKGSNGTVVLEGFHDGRPVAVKRLVKTHHDVALKEIQNLIASDQHPNIVRWYGVEFDQDFVYLSLERCTCSLHELISSSSNSYQNQSICGGRDCHPSNDSSNNIQWAVHGTPRFELWKANGYPSPHLLKLMRDIVHGLAHLHELGIIHRDLKPQNVLIRKERSLCAKVSDMGISKRLSGGMTSLSKQTTGYGSSGWQAPEQLLHERQTRAVDLFSLGCVLFFCITGGKHPFGDSLERDINIVNNRKDLFLIENIPEAMDLISGLLDPNPTLRPKAVDILHHPLFWNPEMRLSFLRDASDRVELEDRVNQSELLKALEGIGSVALNGKWDEKMESAFINDIGRYRRYKYDSVRDLLRVIRNKLNHYRELSKEIQEILGVVPDGFDRYFSSRFPNLLIEVYKVLYRYCAEEKSFSKYFTSTYI